MLEGTTHSMRQRRPDNVSISMAGKGREALWRGLSHRQKGTTLGVRKNPLDNFPFGSKFVLGSRVAPNLGKADINLSGTYLSGSRLLVSGTKEMVVLLH